MLKKLSTSFRQLRLRLLVATSTFFITLSVFANPSFNSFGSGSNSSNITIQTNGNTETITQTNPRGIINWNTFNINSGETTSFVQPAGGSTLNRIDGSQGASAINGNLTATGQLILVNPAGISFGSGAMVNVGSIIATTGSITDANFLAGNYQFTNAYSNPNASIINNGTILANSGLIALVAPNVVNNGLIQATGGSVALGSGGDAFTISLGSGGLISFAVSQNSLTQDTANITNTGTLKSGTIAVSTQAVQQILNSTINMGGLVQANSVTQSNGQVVLGNINIAAYPNASSIAVTGTIQASGTQSSQPGGNINITGKNITLASGSLVDVSGQGGGGTVLIGGDANGLAGAYPVATSTTLASGAKINADGMVGGTGNGNGGSVVLWSQGSGSSGGIPNGTHLYGQITAQGGASGGNGGSIQTAATNNLDINGLQLSTNASQGSAGTWLLESPNINIASTTSGVQTNTNTLDISALQAALNLSNVTVQTNNSSSNVSNNNILVSNPINWTSPGLLTLSSYANINISSGNNITNTDGGSLILHADNTGTGTGTVIFGAGTDAALSGGSGTVKIYYNPSIFGTQDTIYTGGTIPTTYMLINQLGSAADTTTRSLASLSNDPSLWGTNENFALAKNIDATATAGWNNNAGFGPIGNGSTLYAGLFDALGYTISNLTINQPSSNYVGLFGATSSSASISNLGLINSSISGNQYVGNIVGSNAALMSNDYSSGGSISGNSDVGGIAGLNTGILSNVYNTAAINGVGTPGSAIGGLVGYNSSSNAAVSNSYNSGTVTAPTINNVGGLLGINEGNIIASFSVGNVSGNTGVGGLIGENSNGNVSTSFSSGNVSGSNSIGGFVGNDNGGTITNNYAIGEVAGTGQQIGGFVGNLQSGTISYAYSSGQVTGINQAGGFVGLNSGMIENSYWDSTTTGEASGAGVGSSSGLTGGCFTGSNCVGQGNTAELSAQNTYNGWDFSNVWYIPNNGDTAGSYTRPMLRTEFSTSVTNAHQLQLMELNLSQNYVLANNIDASVINNPSDIWGGSYGKGFLPIGPTVAIPFAGTLNGEGYYINDLTINQGVPLTSGVNSNGTFNTTTLPTYVGLFGVALGATISNLGLSNAYVVGGTGGTGILAGGIGNSTFINNVYAIGTVEGSGAVGGIVGLNQGAIHNVFVSGLVIGSAASFSSGGVVGYNQFFNGTVGGGRGTLVNVESGADVINNSTRTSGMGSFGGGLIGYNNYTSTQQGIPFNYLTDGLSYGNVSGNGTLGGLVGQNNLGAVVSSFWDTNSSGQTSAGQTTGNSFGTPGCFGGTGCAAGSANLSNGSTYSGWGIGGNTWGIINGKSYPYLISLYPSTPTAIFGSTSSPNSPVTIFVNGASPSNTGLNTNSVYSNNNFYYFLLPAGTITSGSTLLINGPSNAETVTLAPASLNITGVNLIANTLTLGDSTDSNTISHTTLSTAINGTAALSALYTLSGNNLSLDSGINLSSTAGTTYNLNGDVTVNSGNINLNGPLSLGANSTLTNLTGTSTFNNAINGADSFTINSQGAVTLNNVGTTTPLTSLTVNSPSGITENSTAITTQGNQSYTGLGTLTHATQFIMNQSGSILAFNSGISGGQNVTLSGSGGDDTFNLTGPLNVNSLAINDGSSSNLGSFMLNTGNTQTWSLTGSNAGNVTASGSPSFTFTNIGTLTGGSGNDIFDLATPLFSGAINGGAGNNTLVANNTPTTFTLTGTNQGSVTGLGNGFSNIENLTGAGSNNTLVSNSNTNNTFALTGTNQGLVTGLSGGFSNIQNLTGGGSNNTLDANSNLNNTFTLTGTNQGNVTGLGGSFSNIQNLAGGNGNDTLIANNNTNNAFTLTGTNQGSITGLGGSFSSIENLNGAGSNNTLVANSNTNNTFALTGTNQGLVTGLSGGFSNIQNLAGGGSNNTLDANSNLNNTFTLTGTNQGNVTGLGGSFSNIQNLAGGNSNNTLVANGNTNDIFTLTGTNQGNVTGLSGNFSNIQNLTGGSQDNTFNFADGASISGTAIGNTSGTNTLNYNSYTTDLNVMLSTLNNGYIDNSQNSNITNFSGINNFITNNNHSNTLTFPTQQAGINLVINSPAAGYYSDPINFMGFLTYISHSTSNSYVSFTTPAVINTANNTAVVGGQTMTFINFLFGSNSGGGGNGGSSNGSGSGSNSGGSNTNNNDTSNVANVITQTTTTDIEPSNPIWINPIVENNIESLINQTEIDFGNDFNTLQINPYCYALTDTANPVCTSSVVPTSGE